MFRPTSYLMLNMLFITALLVGSASTPNSMGLAATGVNMGSTATGRFAASEISGTQVSLVVNTTSDSSDGTCDVSHCSLREAINAANTNAGADTISFNIPPDNPGCNTNAICTIQPTIALPAITNDATTIDGFSQPGASPNSNPFGQGLNAVYKIVLDGSLVPYYPAAFELRSSGNLVRGLVIQHFYDGIFVLDADNNHIEGNYIGTDAQGSSVAGNLCHGVSISGVEGEKGSSNNVLGGSTPQARNLIAGNGCVGVGIGPGGNNKVQGNIIGADASGTLPLPNDGDGVYVYNASKNNLIGGQAAGEANLIAFNGDYGVEIHGGFGAVGNTISRNRIHSNSDLGIALFNGGNAGLEAPTITALTSSTVSGKACSACTVEVFSDADGEGAVYEGTTTADVAGTWSFDKPAGLSGPNLTATATDASGNTSEFSAPANVPGAFGKTTPVDGATDVSTSPTLSWGSSSGATGYDYCYDSSNDNACSSWTSNGTNTSVGISGLSSNTTYYWQVRANNSFSTTYANGSATAFWSFTTQNVLKNQAYIPIAIK